MSPDGLWKTTLLLSLGLSASCGGDSSPTTAGEEGEPPDVSISSPSDGAVFPTGGVVPLAGVAVDAEDGDLSSSLTWTSDRDGGLGTGGAVNATLTTGAHVVTARATDSEGMSGSASVSITVEEDNPPVVTITSPEDGATITEGTETTFAGTATDPEDGDLGSSIVWSSDRDGELGTGSSVTATLSAGTHLVTASVTDSGGQTASGSVTVEVDVELPAMPASTVWSQGTHTCALATGGTAYCWGSNDDGELGRGREGPGSARPEAVVGGQRFSSLSLGTSHTCGLTETGQAFCWGLGGGGLLGNGGFDSSSMPREVAGGHRFEALEGGWVHTCALDEEGKAWCWGSNIVDQLGDGTSSDLSATPVAVAADFTFESLAAGRAWTCGVDEAGTAHCWGQGPLGDGSTLRSRRPVEVAGDHTFRQLSSGQGHTCGITTAGQALCWGGNEGGQLGSEGRSVTVPAPVTGGHSFVQIAAGVAHTCAVEATGDLWCWGAAAGGRLGDGTEEVRRQILPVRVAGGYTFTQVTAGGATCGVTEAGSILCWGGNTFGELGDGGPHPVSRQPLQVEGDLAFVRLAQGNAHTCGLEGSGEMYCWGAWRGAAIQDVEPSPVPEAPGFSFARLALGTHTCGLTGAGDAYCWGDNRDGQLGDGTTTYSPTPVRAEVPEELVDLTIGSFFTCGVAASGKAYCWGSNDRGQLGDGSTTSSSVPVPVSGGGSLAQIDAGLSTACGVTDGGDAHCWGEGAGTSATPVPGSPPPLAEIAVGGGHVCGLGLDGRIYCWGDNFHGELGDGTSSARGRDVPEAVASSATFVDLFAGGSHTCGITDAGEALCWGWGYFGQLGSGTTEDALTPSPVVAAGVEFVAFADASSPQGTCALDVEGRAHCWGNNLGGQLGAGGSFVASVPLRVESF
jgi:alpha-tubulin suppressor-like RCC1 family protein